MPCSQNLMVIRVQGTASLVMAEALCYPCFLPPRSQKWPAERWGLHQVSERHQPDQAAARRDHKPAEKRGWKGSAGSRVWTSPSRWVPWQPCSLSLATLWPGVQMGLLVLGSPWPKQDLGAWCCSAFMSSLDAVALCGVGAECFFQHSGCLLMHTGGRWLIRSVLPQSDLVAQANLPPDATSAFLSFFSLLECGYGRFYSVLSICCQILFSERQKVLLLLKMLWNVWRFQMEAEAICFLAKGLWAEAGKPGWHKQGLCCAMGHHVLLHWFVCSDYNKQMPQFTFSSQSFLCENDLSGYHCYSEGQTEWLGRSSRKNRKGKTELMKSKCSAPDMNLSYTVQLCCSFCIYLKNMEYINGNQQTQHPNPTVQVFHDLMLAGDDNS